MTTKEYNECVSLMMHYLNVPISLKAKLGKSRDIHFSGGINLEYLIQNRVDQRWEEGEDNFTMYSKRDLYLEQFRLGYEVQFGFKKFILYGKYFPESIFKADKGPTLKSASIGLVFFNF